MRSPLLNRDMRDRTITHNSFVHIVCLVVLILIIYSNTFKAPFQWDEDKYIVNNQIIKDLHYFFNPSVTKGFEFYDGFVKRYVGYLTFALNYKVHGFAVTGYHIVNIVIHIANAVMVYLLILLTFRTPFMVTSLSRQNTRYIALFSSMLFAAHPIQTEAVTYVFQRFVPLVTFFYLLSLVAYIIFRLETDNQHKAVLCALYALTLLSATLAMKTKENAFTLPVVITLFEFCFFAGSIKKKLLYLAPILLTLAIIPLSLMSLAGTYHIDPRAGWTVAYSQKEYSFTQLRVIVTYLRLLFFPVNQNLCYDYPIFKSFFNLPVILSFVFLSALFGLGIYMVMQAKLKVEADTEEDKTLLMHLPVFRLMGFGILWFFITLSVESSIIPIPMLICEYRVYLPSVGIIFCAVTGVFLLKENLPSPTGGKIIIVTRASRQPTAGDYCKPYAGSLLVVVLVLATVVLSVATYLRNDLWADDLKLWEDTVKKSPAKEQMHYNLGTIYRARNMLDKAIEQYLIAIKLKPDYAEAFNLGLLYYKTGQMEKARKELITSLNIKPDYQQAQQLLKSISR
ncbi:MAG: tetratricopeptide repeat protein [Nitrospirae bacterium]|nr:tetratricopeptide repeat protein [Nitrospirota bacterium]